MRKRYLLLLVIGLFVIRSAPSAAGQPEDFYAFADLWPPGYTAENPAPAGQPYATASFSHLGTTGTRVTVALLNPPRGSSHYPAAIHRDSCEGPVVFPLTPLVVTGQGEADSATDLQLVVEVKQAEESHLYVTVDAGDGIKQDSPLCGHVIWGEANRLPPKQTPGMPSTGKEASRAQAELFLVGIGTLLAGFGVYLRRRRAVRV